MYLNIVPLEIPPLRKHAYDIPLLIDHFLAQANKECAKTTVVSSSALRKLRNYSWPNNITELKQTIHKLVALSPAPYHVVSADDLMTFWSEKKAAVIDEQLFYTFSSLDEATEYFQRSFLRHLLKKNHYNLEQIGGKLNMSPVQLRNKLQELKIEKKL